MTTAREVVNALADYRRRKGITQAAVAHRMNVCKHSVTRLETEQQRNPHWETVTHYAHALGVRLDNVPEESK